MTDVIEGQRSTVDILQAKRVVDISKKIYLLNPNAAPLTILLSKMRKNPTVNPRFGWMEDDIFPSWDAINLAAGYAAGDTSIVVDNDTYFRAGDLIKVPRTGEVMLVTAVNSTTHALTVIRSVGSTAAAALVDDEPLMKLSSASEEGAAGPAAKSTKAADVYNYTEIFKTPLDVTGTENASELHGGKDRNQLRKKKGIEHLVNIERQFWFGERGYDDTGTKRKRFTGGVFEFIKTNVKDAGGALTEVEFEAFCRDAFKHGSSVKWGFASPLAASVINMWAAGRLKTIPKDKTYGIAVQKYLTIHGELNLVINKLFEGTVYGGYLAVLDLENLAYRPLRTRDTVFETNIQAKNVDGFTDQYKTEVGLELDLEKTHAVMIGITS